MKPANPMRAHRHWRTAPAAGYPYRIRARRTVNMVTGAVRLKAQPFAHYEVFRLNLETGADDWRAARRWV
jgi:hypothetical protein